MWKGARHSWRTMQAGTVQQGVEYADELPKLHREIKRDVSWVGAVRAQADITICDACLLTRVCKAQQGCGQTRADAVVRHMSCSAACRYQHVL
jgi:hypothetical protein